MLKLTRPLVFGDDLPSALRALADELEREVGQEPLSRSTTA